MPDLPRTLAHYRLVEKVGEGGMGVVWRAEDSKLGRQVAIKVLPDVFAADPERLARFEREAKLLASLNHPNIAAIYGLEQAEDVRFLVLEMVEGEDLAQILRRGPLAVSEALRIARQVAEALETAHASGVLHRDLKPANVKLAADGRAKVLDFGLAKAFLPDASAPDLSLSPTMTATATQGGVILGTAAYMSPEQARGKAVDRRTDIWAFGCLLFELLSGRQVFRGETVTDVLAAILEREPDWSALPAATPAPARRVLERCLQKDAARRFHDIADVRIFLDEPEPGESMVGVTGGRTGAVPAVSAPPSRRRRLGLHAAWAIGAVVLGGLAWLGGYQRGVVGGGAGTEAPVAFVVPVPEIPAPPAPAAGTEPGQPRFQPFSPPAVSPDGSQLLVVAGDGVGPFHIFLRRFDGLDMKLLPGTEDGIFPMFSPDGSQVAFFADGSLKVLSLAGGTPRAVAQAGNHRGGTWAEDGWIYFAPTISSGIHRVSPTGGDEETLTEPDKAAGERTHRLPELLPGGSAMLVTVGTSRMTTFDAARIDLVTLPEGERRPLIEGAMHARWAPSGHVVYCSAGSLVAVPFDLERLEISGSPQVLVDGVAADPLSGVAPFSLSRSGALAFLSGASPLPSFPLAWIDRSGKVTQISERLLPYISVAASPDGRYLAVSADGANANLWIHDLERDTLSRLTMEWSNFNPTWSPDAQRIVFTSDRTGELSLFVRAADGSGAAEPLWSSSDQSLFPSSWSPDGKHLLVVAVNADTRADLYVLPVDGGEPREFLRTPFAERDATFSPDGRFVAYVSDESGRDEVYVLPFPGPGRKWPISTGGGEGVLWSPEGRELLYGQGNEVFAVPVETQPEFRPGRPRKLFTAPSVLNASMMPDGRLVAVLQAPQEISVRELRVVLNWARDLPRLAPPAR